MFSWCAPGKSLSIVAHRGASAVAPENTLSAFRRALAEGADAIELDVRLTADNELVVIHDASLRRTANSKGLVAHSTLAEIRLLDAGRWFDPRFAGERIPTLVEVFEIVPPTIGVNIELKPEHRGRRGALLVERCAQLIVRCKREASVLVTSFHHPLVALSKKRHPGIPAGILLHPLRQRALSPVRIATAIGADYIVFGGKTLSKRLTQKAHDQGIRVAEYTVNTEHRLRRASRYGVDAIITNCPGMMLNL